jgi:hypothetical protein
VATKEEIKKAILEVAGNPESGVIFEMAERFADAVIAIDTPVAADVKSAEKEVRVTKPTETR